MLVQASNETISTFEACRAIGLKKDCRQYLNISDPASAALGRILPEPYWFRVHVYFDVVSGDDFVVLTYGHSKSCNRPIVRVQSESILNRLRRGSLPIRKPCCEEERNFRD